MRCGMDLFQRAGAGHADVPQQRQPDRVADPPVRLVSSGQRRRRRGGALERPDLALPAERLSCSAATDRALRRELHADDLTIQDWGITYEELEPFYDRFEYLCGISGKAGNLKGEIQPGGNPFEGPRNRDYPTPPMQQTYAPTCSPRRRASWAIIRSRTRRRICRSPIPTRSASYGAVHLLRVLRAVRLRQLFQGESADPVLPVLMRKPNFRRAPSAKCCKSI